MARFPSVLDEMVRGFAHVAAEDSNSSEEISESCGLHAPRTSSAHIEAFSDLLTSFRLPVMRSEDDFVDLYLQTGFYLSALINNCRDSRIFICTNDLNIPYLGYRVTDKQVHVEGYVGPFAGRQMVNSGLFIYGGAGDCTGEGMISSKLFVKGDVDDYAGKWMRDSILDVCCAGDFFCYEMESGTAYANNVERQMADGMSGGVIFVHGRYQSLGVTHGGKVYHKKKLIINKEGKRARGES